MCVWWKLASKICADRGMILLVILYTQTPDTHVQTESDTCLHCNRRYGSFKARSKRGRISSTLHIETSLTILACLCSLTVHISLERKIHIVVQWEGRSHS